MTESTTAPGQDAPSEGGDTPSVDIAALVDSVRARLSVVLPQEWKTELTRWGGYAIGFENTIVFVDILENGDETVLRVSAPVVLDLRVTPELCKFVATEFAGYYFGHAYLLADDDDADIAHLYYKHSILGESLDPAELHRVIGAVAWMGDAKSKEFKERFGGRLWSEETA